MSAKKGKGVSPKPAETTTEEDVRSYILKRKSEGENYSVEHLRRALNIGYKKAKRIFDEMEGRLGKAPADDDYNGKPSAPKQKRARKASTATQQSPAPDDDDGVKTRSSRRIKRDLGKWAEGGETYRESEKILEKLMAHPNAWPFNQPVDPVALNIPDYLDIVHEPMDLGTVKKNLEAGEYEDSQEMLDDIALVWANCFLYNPPEHPVSQWARELSAYLQKLIQENEKRRKNDDDSELTRKAFVYPSPVSKKEVQAKRKKLEDMADGTYPEHQTHEAKWLEKYEQLQEFKELYGHCRVAKTYDENPALGTWVHAMRQYKKKGKLSEERTRKLDELGFTWRIHGATDTAGDGDGDDEAEVEEATKSLNRVGRRKSTDAEIDDSAWEERFANLEEYQKRFGHCKVPKKWDEDPGLGAWVAQMRERRRSGKLDDEKVARLDELGFTWSFQTQWDKAWEDRFEQLKQYRETHGTCSVSKTDPAHKALHQWVHDLRANRRKGKLVAERIKRLDEIGFIWNPAAPVSSASAAATAAAPVTTNAGTNKRKRGRPRKADAEVALSDANLWGMRVVEMEEKESDTDTESAWEGEEDDYEEDGHDQNGVDAEMEPSQGEDEEEDEGEEGSIDEAHSTMNGQDEMDEDEGEEAATAVEPQQQQQESTTPTATVASGGASAAAEPTPITAATLVEGGDAMIETEEEEGQHEEEAEETLEDDEEEGDEDNNEEGEEQNTEAEDDGVRPATSERAVVAGDHESVNENGDDSGTEDEEEE